MKAFVNIFLLSPNNFDATKDNNLTKCLRTINFSLSSFIAKNFILVFVPSHVFSLERVGDMKSNSGKSGLFHFSW